MSKIVDGKKYLTATEAMQLGGVSRQFFYDNVKPRLTPHYIGARKSPLYEEQQVLEVKEGKSVRRADITIQGIFADWTEYLEGLGYDALTLDDTRELTVLPDDAIRLFKLPSGRKFFKRERMSYASGTPICVWSTYYPADLLQPVLDQLIKGESVHAIEYIKEMHGLVVKDIDERYTARLTTFEELNRFQLRNDQAVLTLQRASYTEGQKNLIMYSDMALLGNWFDVRRQYQTSHWD